MLDEHTTIPLLAGIKRPDTALLIDGATERQTIKLLNNKQASTVSLEQKQLYNELHIKGNVLNFAFKQNSFDLIVLHNITGTKLMQPKNQHYLLKNIFLLLKQTGTLIFALDNRYSPSYLILKMRDLRYTMKNFRSLKIKEKWLRLLSFLQLNFLHLQSRKRYHQFLKETGFSKIFSYCAPRGFGFPCLLTSDKNVYNFYCRHLDSHRKRHKQLLINILNIVGLNHVFTNSYVLIGQKSDPRH